MADDRDDAGLPSFLADLEPVDATPEDELAVAEADEDYAAGRFIRCYSEADAEALLDRFSAPEAKAS